MEGLESCLGVECPKESRIVVVGVTTVVLDQASRLNVPYGPPWTDAHVRERSRYRIAAALAVSLALSMAASHISAQVVPGKNVNMVAGTAA